jgi:hypothetical protein
MIFGSVSESVSKSECNDYPHLLTYSRTRVLVISLFPHNRYVLNVALAA